MSKSKKTRDLLFQLHRYLGLFVGILIAIAYSTFMTNQFFHFSILSIT